MSDQGWISLDRKILDHWLMGNSKYFHAWVTILFRVNYKEKKAIIKGKIYNCERGSALYSLDSWAKIFGRKWTRSMVITFFKLLEGDAMISLKSDSKTSYLSVCNYDTYQQTVSTPSPAVLHPISGSPPQLNKEKKEKKENNILKPKKIKHSFEDSPLIEKQNFKVRFPNWDKELLNHYYNSALEYSGSKGAKYIDWGLAISGWQRREEIKQTTKGSYNGKQSFQERSGSVAKSKIKRFEFDGLRDYNPQSQIDGSLSGRNYGNVLEGGDRGERRDSSIGLFEDVE